MLQDGRQTPLVSNIIPLGVLVLLEGICFLVDGIIGQMHAEVIQVAAHWALVLLCGKTSQTFFVNEAPKW